MKRYFYLRPVPAYIITSVVVALACGSTVLVLFLRRENADGELVWLTVLPAVLFLLWTVSAVVVFFRTRKRYDNVFNEILSTFPKEDVDAFKEFTMRSPEPEEVSRWVCGKLMSYESARFNNIAALSSVAMSREIFWRISEQSLLRLDFGDYWERTYGLTDLGNTKDIRHILSSGTREEFNAAIKRITENAGTGFNIYGTLELASEKNISVLIQGGSVKNPATGKIVCMGTVCDMNIETALSERYKAEKIKTGFLQNACPDVLYEVDVKENRLRSLNPRKAKDLLDMGDMQDFDGQRRPYWENIHPDDREGFVDRFFNYDHMAIMPEQKMQFEYRVKNKDGDYIWVEHQAQVIAYDEDGKVSRVIGRIADITAKKRIALKQRTNIDALTGAFLRTSVAREFENSFYDGNKRCVVLVNINGFHLLNNEYGYESGDQILRHVVTVLWESQRGRCVVGRLDSDTFVVGMMEVNEENTPQEMVQRIISGFEKPLTIDNNKIVNIAVSVSCSSVFDRRCEFDEAYEQAELALKESKKTATSFTNVFTDYTDSLQERSEGSHKQLNDE